MASFVDHYDNQTAEHILKHLLSIGNSLYSCSPWYTTGSSAKRQMNLV